MRFPFRVRSGADPRSAAPGPPPTLPSPAGARVRWRLVRVRGRSMLPTLADGDVVLLHLTRHARPAALVVVQWPDTPPAVKRLVHREPDGGWWVERDSRVEGSDSWSRGAVPGDGLIGVVRFRCWPRPGRLPGRA